LSCPIVRGRSPSSRAAGRPVSALGPFDQRRTEIHDLRADPLEERGDLVGRDLADRPGTPASARSSAFSSSAVVASTNSPSSIAPVDGLSARNFCDPAGRKAPRRSCFFRAAPSNVPYFGFSGFSSPSAFAAAWSRAPWGWGAS
jgi:hypothetical protein